MYQITFDRTYSWKLLLKVVNHYLLLQIQSSRDAKTLQEYLTKHHNFKSEWVDTLYNYAKCLYEIGNYEDASKYLYSHRILCSPSDKNYLNGLWGKLASDILMQVRFIIYFLFLQREVQISHKTLKIFFSSPSLFLYSHFKERQKSLTLKNFLNKKHYRMTVHKPLFIPNQLFWK